MAVFVSYSHRDGALVERLSLRLLKRNVKLWRDVWRTATGDDFAARIREALADSSAACFFVSKHSLESTWVKDEIRMARERAAEDRDFLIIPVRLDDSEVPEALRDRLTVDCRSDAEQGLERILAAIESVENAPPKGRVHLGGSYYLHFGIEERVADDGYTLCLDVVSFDLEETYSVLSQFEFHSPCPDLWRQAGLAAPHALNAYLIRVCADEFAANPGILKLSAGGVEKKRFSIALSGCPVEVVTRTTTVGDGPRGVLVFNSGALFAQVGRTLAERAPL